MSALDWAIDAARNANADPLIPARDGASARDLPGLIRSVMASVRAVLDDQGGAILSTGAGNTYVLATAAGVSELRPGLSVAFWADRDNTDSPFLNVDGTGPITLRDSDGNLISVPGTIRGGNLYRATLNAVVPKAPLQWRLGAAGQNGGSMISPDARGTLAGRSAYDGQATNFIYLAVSPAPWTLYFKRTGTAADWSDGFPIQVLPAVTTVEASAARDAAQASAASANGFANAAAAQAALAATQVLAAASAGRVYQTYAALAADLSPGDKVSAQVVNDPDATKNGTYVKSGGTGTGTWALISAVNLLTAANRAISLSRSITEFGGAPALGDSGAALNAARSATTTNGLIRLPGTAGDAYNFPTGIAMADRVMDPDPGVVVNAVADFSAGKVTRPLLIQRNQSGVVDHHYFAPDVNRAPVAKQQFLSPEACERTEYGVVNQADNTIFVDAPWDSDAVANFAPTGAGADQATWSAPNNWRGVLVPLRASQEIGGVFTTTTDAGLSRAAVVEGSAGKVWLWAGGGGGLTVSSKPFGSAKVDAAAQITWPEFQKDPAWFNQNALWALRAVSDTRLDLLLNGVVVAKIDLAALNVGFLLRGGFMTYGSGVNGSAGFAQMYRATRTVRRGNPNLSLLTIGDSITTDYFHGNWPQFVTEWLDGTAGIRLTAIDNRAVSGETSGQQLARLQSVGVGSNTDAVIYIGTNDIRYGTPPGVTVANVSSMIDILQAAGIVVTLAVPYLYYDQALVPNGFGIQAANGGAGAQTRAALIRLGATRGVRVVDLQQVTGQIRCSFGDQLSSFLRDNLHPMIFGSKVLARAIAEGIVTARCAYTRATPDRIAPASWLQAGWTNGFNPLRFSVEEGGRFQIGGVLTINASSRADGTTIIRLPQVFWPRRPYQISGWSEGGRAVVLLAGIAGNIDVYGVSGGGTNVYFDGPPWPLA